MFVDTCLFPYVGCMIHTFVETFLCQENELNCELFNFVMEII